MKTFSGGPLSTFIRSARRMAGCIRKKLDRVSQMEVVQKLDELLRDPSILCSMIWLTLSVFSGLKIPWKLNLTG